MEEIRCAWCKKDTLYQQYHDQEWGRLVTNDAILFEFLVLESFQCGLSWITILHKRENFRKAFDDFNYHKIAEYGELKVNMLVQDAGIIRNRTKIVATINNAQQFIQLRNEFGCFYKYLSRYTGGERIINQWNRQSEVPAKTALSDSISKDLKKRGFKYLGSTVVYAYLQAVGIVDDHLENCFIRTQMNEKISQSIPKA
ncbi:DNA-3-methyladenine glycosylase I [Elizabethkingia argentiflava]|uniref:DNA-3-methyladenine glycosylase I n=1 Tax=Elizabethkingia argenteiflava TaxID=2681556 RepID=A0A845PWU8_9FLAO|nr:DNA-3-methyladenine glycosylase I [Elizabethkingia argenteiflava]NAW50798.1 DNA-3-methyladenine glycosylase I [Elizabethkingia argenteiflava]